MFNFYYYQVPCPIQIPVHIPVEVPVPQPMQFSSAQMQQFSNFSPQQMLQNYQMQQNPPITPGNVPTANGFGSAPQYTTNAQISPNAGQFGQQTAQTTQQPFSFQ